MSQIQSSSTTTAGALRWNAWTASKRSGTSGLRSARAFRPQRPGPHRVAETAPFTFRFNNETAASRAADRAELARLDGKMSVSDWEEEQNERALWAAREWMPEDKDCEADYISMYDSDDLSDDEESDGEPVARLEWVQRELEAFWPPRSLEEMGEQKAELLAWVMRREMPLAMARCVVESEIEESDDGEAGRKVVKLADGSRRDSACKEAGHEVEDELRDAETFYDLEWVDESDWDYDDEHYRHDVVDWSEYSSTGDY